MIIHHIRKFCKTYCQGNTWIGVHVLWALYQEVECSLLIIIVIIIPGKHEVKELQKTAILGTAHILRKVLM